MLTNIIDLPRPKEIVDFTNKFKNVIFLDIDGVLNCDLHYESKQFQDYFYSDRAKKKTVTKEDWLFYEAAQVSTERIELMNTLCSETNSCAVISSTWRHGKTVEELQEMFNYFGGTFTIIGKTPNSECRVRGYEIKKWLEDNTDKFFGVKDHNFYRYAIIDDDSDMLLYQQNHFFCTDTYAGLTYTICYKIKRFFTHETF